MSVKFKKSFPIPIKKEDNYDRIGINDINENEIQDQNNKDDKNNINIKIRFTIADIPPSNFTPNTPPEFNLIDNMIKKNNKGFEEEYLSYSLGDKVSNSY